MPVDTSVMRGGSFAGYLAKSVAGAVDVTLNAQEAQNGTIAFTGAITANIIVNFPLGSESGRAYNFYNSTTGAFTLTVKGALGSGLAITQTKKVVAVWNGADFVAYTAEL